MANETPAPNHWRISKKELYKLNNNIIKIKQDRSAKNINSCLTSQFRMGWFRQE